MTDKRQPKTPEPKELPDVVVNPQNGRRYLKGKFLGKGGFARCYELTDTTTKEIFAGKVVSKTLLTKKHQKDKMAQEIQIHRTLNHKGVVKFQSFFEDDENVYVLLELCRRRSLMELHKRRRAITEPEARYFLSQIVEATSYLHSNRVIHRDLKLGNLFINEEMEVKIGDFGLATQLDFEGERKKTLCGTPNYIAPEMLGKKGHSYEVDIWAIGCILYTLLVGKPPFETASLKETYAKIKNNEYQIPSRISAHARHLIQRLLQPDPSKRPTITEVSQFDFFTQGFLPVRLPTSCLTMAPKFPMETNPITGSLSRKPLNDVNECLSPRQQARKDLMAAPVRALRAVPEDGMLRTKSSANNVDQDPSATPSGMKDGPVDAHLGALFRQLTALVHAQPAERDHIRQDEAEDPACSPVFWISKWVDYSDKYGIGYQLCDNSVGVLFNDTTRLILDAAARQLQYVEKTGTERYFTMANHPADIEKKITLLNYFRNYMNEHLLKAGATMAPKEGDELARLPYMRTWFRTKSAIVLHLTNGTLQINFYNDHTKIILCPLMGAVTYINQKRDFNTYRFSLLEQYGCNKDLFSRLRYAKTMVERLVLHGSGSATISTGGILSTGSENHLAPPSAGLPPAPTSSNGGGQREPFQRLGSQRTKAQ